MPKPKSRLTLKLNLLKPQSNPEKLLIKLTRWLLSSGRYIFVAVNAVVLIAFGARFKLDADLAAKKEAIEEQIPYIESLKPYEILIRETQLKLSTIDSIKKGSLDWLMILKKISDQTPRNVKIISINIGKNLGTATIHITGQTQTNSELTSFIIGLKGEDTFSEVNLAGVGLEQGVIKFIIDISAKLTNTGGKSP
ncbi:MAG: PilN domain-containing protein [Candidatus Daviesbacteria bacterium]|nr:PilN domain-containing protein [Candidatus Daviesbacteria bacterium]